MNFNKIILAICLGITLSGMSSCKFSKDELKAIARKEAGKDNFRDSEKWGKVITKTFDLEAFTNIALMGNADVKFTQGDVLSVEAYGNEKAIEDNDIRVEDGTLKVSLKPGALKNPPSIKLIVTAPAIENISVSGAGDVDIKKTTELEGNLSILVSGAGDVDLDEVACKALSISISGAGDVKAKHIKSETANVTVSGAGDVEADLTATNIDVTITGAGDADLNVKCDHLSVTASGTGDVELGGECVNLTKRSSGMASIDSRKLSVKNLDIQR